MKSQKQFVKHPIEREKQVLWHLQNQKPSLASFYLYKKFFLGYLTLVT